MTSASVDSYDPEKEKFNKGPVYTDSVSINKVLKDATERQLSNGSRETKQLFTFVKGRVDVDKSGLTIPMPKMKYGRYKPYWVENKKNRGTSSAVVLTRESSGDGVENLVKNAVAYTGIAAGVAGVATMVVLGVAAGVAAAGGTIGAGIAGTVSTVSFGASAIGGVLAGTAATAAIPFVG